MIIGDEAIQISAPWVTLSCILLWVLLFLGRQFLLPHAVSQDLLNGFGYVPVRLLGHPMPASSFQAPVWITPLTAAFLQGSWFRLIGNAVFAWIAGRHVEDSLGRRAYLAFMFVVVLASCAGDVAMHPDAVLPRYGTGGLVAGVIGGYVVLFPSARYRSLIYVWFYGWVTYSVPAWAALCLWILVQAGLAFGQGDSFAAIGLTVQLSGFLAGIGMALLFRHLGVAAQVVEGPDKWRDRNAAGIADPSRPLPPMQRRDGAPR